MLKKLRKQKTKKIVWIILAVLIVPAFVLWGSGSLTRNKQESMYAGKIFGRPVSLIDFKDAIYAVRNQLIMQFGDKYSEAQKSLNLEELAWDRLMLTAEAKKRGIRTSDREVIETIESYPIFFARGKFDNHIYLQILQYVFRAQPRLFEEQIRQSIAISKLYKKLTDSISLTDKEIEEEYGKANEQISVYYLAALLSDFKKDLGTNDKELKEYFAKNELHFKQPPSFNIEYISWTSEDKNPEEIKKKVETIIIKKDNFAKESKELGFEVKETGLFGQTDPIPGIGWSPEILNILSKAKPPELLPIVQMDKNYYLIRLKERKDSYIPDFEAIKNKVKENFVQDMAAEIAKQKIENCLKTHTQNTKAVNLERAAADCALKYGSTGLFTYGSYIEGIGMSDNFWLAAQNLKDKDSSDLIQMPSGLYIIQIKSRVPVDEKKFAQEKTEFSQKLLSQKKQESFTRFFEDLKAKANRF